MSLRVIWADHKTHHIFIASITGLQLPSYVQYMKGASSIAPGMASCFSTTTPHSPFPSPSLILLNPSSSSHVILPRPSPHRSIPTFVTNRDLSLSIDLFSEYREPVGSQHKLPIVAPFCTCNAQLRRSIVFSEPIPRLIGSDHNRAAELFHRPSPVASSLPPPSVFMVYHPPSILVVPPVTSSGHISIFHSGSSPTSALPYSSLHKQRLEVQLFYCVYAIGNRSCNYSSPVRPKHTVDTTFALVFRP
ncbi:hypothetical protein DACRYDRAFT_104616 [Dacryopinax primogenitus]|uniref:Uncharacterized protein n=1 Tax=Dacryopinax primogenitus (strain DJM 731) TaxID=1858805 RepID=M5G3E7_DACPD|nr:uncharacterized protein DACRYDRAFT_104616 [Dacryopinax primogenitus]EJU04741.1 hypothetical protein DACRYDRAFT_104616 [Dacryopinax primogenitus]